MSRDKKYIGSAYQKKFIFKFVLLFVFIILLISVLFLFWGFDLIKHGGKSGSLSSQLVRLGVFVFQLKFLVLIFLLILLVIYLAVRFSHKIAGPLYNIEKKLDDIAEGDLTTNIFLRGDDEVQELADKINFIINDFREVIEAAHEEIKELEKFINNSQCVVNQEVKSELLEKIERLKKVISKYKILKD